MLVGRWLVVKWTEAKYGVRLLRAEDRVDWRSRIDPKHWARVEELIHYSRDPDFEEVIASCYEQMRIVWNMKHPDEGDEAEGTRA